MLIIKVIYFPHRGCATRNELVSNFTSLIIIISLIITLVKCLSKKSGTWLACDSLFLTSVYLR